MKKSQLDKLIKEEISRVLNKSVNEAAEKWVVYDTKTKKRLPNAGKTWATMKAANEFAAKQKNAEVASEIWYFDKIKESVNEGFTKLSDEQKAKVKDGAKKGLSPEDVIDQYFDYDDKYLQSVKALMDKITA